MSNSYNRGENLEKCPVRINQEVEVCSFGLDLGLNQVNLECGLGQNKTNQNHWHLLAIKQAWHMS